MTTTNYYNTFIQIAEDCPAQTAEAPPLKGEQQTVANLKYEMLAAGPYQHTSDDVLFEVFAIRNAVSQKSRAAEREKFFSKGQPCFRASPLTKRYGWGVHSDAEGKIALVAVESKEYKKLSTDPTIKQLKAMRSKR